MSLLNILLEDYKRYITSNTGFHSGNLYEHSVWCAIYVNSMFTGECKELEPELSQYIGDIPETEKNTLIIAALLHDIGKGGDSVEKFFDKPNHPSIGGEFYVNKTPPNCYKLSNGVCVDFKEMIRELGLESSYNTIGFLVRWHWFIGDCIREKNFSSKPLSEIEPNIISQIKWYIYKQFNKACHEYKIEYSLRKDLFKKLYVIWVADLLATKKYPCSIPNEIKIGDISITNPDEPHSTRTWKYKDFDVKNTLNIRDQVLEIFDTGFETPDFSKTIIKYRRYTQIGDLYYKDSNTGNPFIFTEVPKPEDTAPIVINRLLLMKNPKLMAQQKAGGEGLKPITDSERKSIESYKAFCKRFLDNGGDPMGMDVFIGFPTVITRLKDQCKNSSEFRERISDLYSIIANDNAEFVCSFTSEKQLHQLFGEDESKYIINIPKDIFLYHGRVSQGNCIVPNISNDGPFWLFKNKNNTHKYAIDRTTKLFPEKNGMCWNVLTYQSTNNLRLLDLTTVEIRNKLRNVFKESHCQSWFWRNSDEYPFQDKEEEGRIATIKNLLDLLFPEDEFDKEGDDFYKDEDEEDEDEDEDEEKEEKPKPILKRKNSKEKIYTRWSHVTADKVLVKNLRDMFGLQIDGWYIPDIGALDEEICIFRPADNLKLISHEFLDADRLMTVLERCQNGGSTPEDCKKRIEQAFQKNNLFCVKRDDGVIECYLPDEFIKYLNNITTDEIKTLLKSGNIIQDIKLI